MKIFYQHKKCSKNRSMYYLDTWGRAFESLDIILYDDNFKTKWTTVDPFRSSECFSFQNFDNENFGLKTNNRRSFPACSKNLPLPSAHKPNFSERNIHRVHPIFFSWRLKYLLAQRNKFQTEILIFFDFLEHVEVKWWR